MTTVARRQGVRELFVPEDDVVMAGAARSPDVQPGPDNPVDVHEEVHPPSAPLVDGLAVADVAVVGCGIICAAAPWWQIAPATQGAV